MLAAEPPVLEVHEIDFGYRTGAANQRLTLEGVTFAAYAGEAIALLGPSGVGKTTLARICAGLQAPLRGQVLRRGLPVAAPSSSIAVSFQNYPCFPWLTVERNVLFGLEETRQCDAAHREYAYWLLQKVGLDQARDQYPRELSGGMQQRLSLARCLALEPDVLILDEPFSAVDQTTKADLLELVLELQSITRFTLLVILHDLKDAYSLADRVVVLAGRPARSVLDLELSGTDYITFQEKVLGAMNENRPTEPLTGSLLGLLACVRARENPSRQLLAKLSGRSSLLPVARRIKPPDVAYVLDLLRDRDPERLRLGILLSEAITANPDISKQLTTLWSRSLPTEARLALVRILTNTPGLLEPWIESEAVSFICEHWNDFKTHISRDLKGPRGQSLHYMSLNPETETGRLAALRLLAAASLSSETQDISRIIERLNGTGIPCLESLLSATGAQK